MLRVVVLGVGAVAPVVVVRVVVVMRGGPRVVVMMIIFPRVMVGVMAVP